MKKHNVRTIVYVLTVIVTVAFIRNMIEIDIKVAIKIDKPNNSKDDSTKRDTSVVTTQGSSVSTNNAINMMNHLNKDDGLHIQEAFTKGQENVFSGGSNNRSISGSQNDKYNLSLKEYMEQEYPDWRDSGSIYEISDIAFAYTDVTEMESRRHRFPSIAQRVKLYMSNWYLPPCPNTQRIQYQYFYHHPEQPYVDIDNYSDTSTTSIGSTSNTPNTTNTTSDISVVMVQEISLHRPLQTKFEDYIHIPYNPPRRFIFDSEFHADDTIHVVDRQQFVQCKQRYCIDLLDSFLPFIDRHFHSTTNERIPIPILYQFGDSRESKPSLQWNGQPQYQHQHQHPQRQIRNPRIPVIQKTRNSMSRSELLSITDVSKHTCYKNGERRTPKYNPTIKHDKYMVHEYQQFHLEPIIFKLNVQRHYANVFHLIRNIKPIQWEEKRNSACFRGALTGRYPPMKLYELNQLSAYDRCQLLPRCYFTYIHRTSTLIDAKLTKIPIDKNIPISWDVHQGNANSSDTSTGEEGGKHMDLMGDPLSIEEMLQYKAIVILQGNDVSSGLKWALFSNSVVMMPIPTVTSWAMEEWLIPWVHYVPIEVYPVRNDTKSGGNDNGDNSMIHTMTDAEEKMQWIINNDSRAKEIAHAGKLWMADLLLHPRANTDEIEIFDEMAQRYISHFSILSN